MGKILRQLLLLRLPLALFLSFFAFFYSIEIVFHFIGEMDLSSLSPSQTA